MYPTLIHFGPLMIKTLTIFLCVAFLAAGFTLWRKGREEHYSEEELFDGFLIALLIGLVAGRVGYGVIHIQSFGFDLLRWFDFVSHPGFSIVSAALFATLYVYRFAKKRKWDAFEVLDFWSLSLSMGLGILMIGFFFDGTLIGVSTSLPIGVRFPTLLEPHHPIQLYFAGFFFLLYGYLSWAEYHYRTFNWYRSGKKTAQTGYLISIFTMVTGLFWLMMTFLLPSPMMINGISLDILGSVLMISIGVVLLYVRSGRALPFTREKKKKQAQIQRFQA